MKPEEVEDELRKAIEGTVDIYQDTKLLAPVSCFCKTDLDQGLLLNGIDHWLGAACYLVQGSQNPFGTILYFGQQALVNLKFKSSKGNSKEK